MKELCINKNDKILVIAPHPDDESIGVGGMLCLYPNQCAVIIATDGGMAAGVMKRDEMILRRKAELDSVMNMAGILDYKMLPYHDGELSMYKECFQDVHFSDYTLVFLPNRNENHPDHISVFQYAVNEIKKQGIKDTHVYQYETRRPYECSDFIDITTVIDKKVDLIYGHKSQIEIFDHAAVAKSINHYHACEMGCNGKYFEAYEAFPISNMPDILNEEGMQLSKNRREKEYYRKWISNKIEGREISKELLKNGINNVCIYGYGMLGKMLYKDLYNDGVSVRYFLDKRVEDRDTTEVPIYFPNSNYGDVELVIITTLFEHDEIRMILEKYGYKRTVTLQELLSGMEY